MKIAIATKINTWCLQNVMKFGQKKMFYLQIRKRFMDTTIKSNIRSETSRNVGYVVQNPASYVAMIVIVALRKLNICL